ncbi:MAG: ammonium transporter, partial [Actinomycetota bacterium]
GLAFFYGGMDRGRNVLNMLMMNFYCVLVIPVLWVVVGYTLAQEPFDATFIGGFDKLFLEGIGVGEDNGKTLAVVAFLGMFAAITPALISGAVADRMKFSAWAIFVPVWSLLVYVPVFKWVYGGWLFDRGSIDFAGGTAIHVNAGIAALACVLVLGKRKGWPKEGQPPHSMPLVMIGTGILWFGWFGFNAGSALVANGQAVQAFMNTFLAAAAAGLVWVVVEWRRDGHPTNLGAASGIVAGLVAITPAAGYVSGMAPLAIGAIAGLACCYGCGSRLVSATTTRSTSWACTSSVDSWGRSSSASSPIPGSSPISAWSSVRDSSTAVMPACCSSRPSPTERQSCGRACSPS